MFYAFLFIFCLEINSFAKPSPFTLDNINNQYIFGISPEYQSEISELKAHLKQLDWFPKINYWGMESYFMGFLFQTIDELKRTVPLNNIITSISDFEELNPKVSSFFGFYEIYGEGEIYHPYKYATPSVTFLNRMIESINAKTKISHGGDLIPLTFYSISQRQDEFEYLTRFAEEGSLPCFDPFVDMGMYLHDILHMKGSLITPVFMFRDYQKLVKHFLVFLTDLISKQSNHQDYVSLYNVLLTQVAMMIDFDFGNLYPEYLAQNPHALQYSWNHEPTTFHLESSTKPNVKMSLPFKEMLLNLISDSLVDKEVTIRIDIHNLVDEFFRNHPEIDPDIIFLSKKADGKFKTYKDFLALSRKQINFLTEYITNLN